MLVVPGTGLITDAFGFMSDAGPYSLFKWSLTAKLCGCKLLFVSVGVGPLYGRVGRSLVKSSLALADYRSYRDAATQSYLSSIGFVRENDRVHPDLVFSLPAALIPHKNKKENGRTVVGVGVMAYAGKYGNEKPDKNVYQDYLGALVAFIAWLLSHEYDVRLLVGDSCDETSIRELKGLLSRQVEYNAAHVVDEPVSCSGDLLSQIAACDIVVATRFHSVVSALLLNKPVISISFHSKCKSLMSDVGLEQYCGDIDRLHSESLIETFCVLERNADKVKALIKERVEEFRVRLHEQYELIFGKRGAYDAISRETDCDYSASGKR